MEGACRRVNRSFGACEASLASTWWSKLGQVSKVGNLRWFMVVGPTHLRYCHNRDLECRGAGRAAGLGDVVLSLAHA